jgi:hypothetical protein
VQGEDLLVRRCRGWGVNIVENLFNNSFFTRFFLLQDRVSRVKQTPHTVFGHSVQVRNEMYSKIIPKKTKQFIKIQKFIKNIFFSSDDYQYVDESEAQCNRETNILGDPTTLLQRLGFYDCNIFFILKGLSSKRDQTKFFLN